MKPLPQAEARAQEDGAGTGAARIRFAGGFSPDGREQGPDGERGAGRNPAAGGWTEVDGSCRRANEKPPSIKAESGSLPSAVILSTPFVHPPAYGIQGNPMGRMGRGGGVGIKKNPCKYRGFIDH